MSTLPVSAVELPIACVSGTCGINTATNTPITWLTSGAAIATKSGNTLTVNQSTETVTLNWQSFNISADGKVIFSQPSTNSIALNRIFQESPSQILGSIKTQLNSDPSKSGGQIYLINPNGFVFGANSSVNAAGILVSTLGITDKIFQNGLLSSVSDGTAALASDGRTVVQGLDDKGVYQDLYFDSNGVRVPAGTQGATTLPVQLVVKSGAQITADSGGRILLASQAVDNAGTLSSPDGQVILAAGDKVYLSASTDNSLRGLLVEVAAGGTAWNELTGKISADRGNITMVGLAVNQDGRISASTSVSENGSVRLLARDSASAPTLVENDTSGNKNLYWESSRTGKVTLGSGSSIDVSADLTDAATAVDDQEQLLPSVEVVGEQIVMQGGANITAHGGKLTMTASAVPDSVAVTDADARIRIDSGAIIDLSGSDAVRSVADNIVSVELRGTELADSPDQRNGALRGKTVTVDARVGTAVADVSGEIATIGKTVAQRTSKGGTATFISTGDVVTSKDASINVSGGQTTYTGAMVNTSQLITADGKLVDIGSAKEDVTYVGVASPTTTIKHDRWGVVEKVGQQTGSHYEAGYVEGSSAGTVQFIAPTMVLNGTLTGNAVNGAYQRDASSDSYAKGGTLIIGSTSFDQDYRAPAVNLSVSSSNTVVADDASVPSGIPLTLSTDYLTKGGFTQTEIYSNGSVTFAADAPLTLLSGSSIKVLTSQQININSSITDLAGTLSFTGGSVNVADNVKLDVSGSWINDIEVDNSVLPVTTLYQNAGSISLATTLPDSALIIGSNTQFIANGGAWLKSSGTVTGGKGGSIALQSSDQDSSFALGDNVTLQAYGVNGAAGGTFTLAAGRLQIANGNVWATSQLYDPNSATSNEFFKIGSSLFTAHGFGTINLIASGGTDVSQGDALQVVSNTNIDAVVSTLQLSSQLSGRASGGEVAGFSTVITLPDYQRSASSISLSVTPYSNYAGKSTLGTLDVQQGAVIKGDAGTSIALSSQAGSIDIDGALIAKGGSIKVEINPPSTAANKTPYDANLGIDIGADALLDVSGIAVPTPNDSGLLQGKVYDGGSIQLIADRGTLLIEHESVEDHSVLNVSGTSAAFDVATTSTSTPYKREQVASNAGSIELTASESIGIYGKLSAHAGVGDTGQATGGTLAITLTRQQSDIPAADVTATFPSETRIVELTNDAVPTSTGALTPGLASISVAQIETAGVDDLRLTAYDQVMLDAGINLSLQRRIEIDAPALAVKTGNSNSAASIAAPYVLLANSQTGRTDLPVAASGSGILNVNADDMIDLLGTTVLRNIGTANLNSSGDIRLRGAGTALVGSLQLAGNLTLQAERVYASTATQYVITATDSTDAATGDAIEHTVDIKQNGTSPGTPLSAASSITINAANITQEGTLLAPFGTLNLNATDSLKLGTGSITSVSGDDALIPYGFTDSNGTTWYYQNTAVTDVPARQITLNGSNSVDIASGAKVDLSGGGDLYAYEWVKGTGGTNDAFGFKEDSTGTVTTTLTNPGLFAVIPALGTQVAPYDAQESKVVSALGLQAGDTVYLSGGGGLAAGYYTLLPARYALLPGAYLVTAASGFSTIQPGTTAALADGTPVVAGYRSFSDTGLGGTSYSGFAIYSGSWGRELAEYKDSYASTFFSDATSTTADAGQLSIITGNELIANGAVNSQAAAGGQAATIDISASNLEIVGTIGTGSAGTVQLDDDVLNSWKAGRLLLGGSHSIDGSTIAVAANTVTVDGDAHLVGDEVVLVARDQVAINAGSSVKSNSAIADKAVSLPETSTITLTGEGADRAAFVAVSDIDNISLTRDTSTSSSSQGTVSIAAGAQLNTRGQLMVDAPGGAVLAGTLGGTGASWSLGSSHIVFADDSAPTGQLTITSGVLSAMQSASAVNLASTGSIDFTHYASNTGNVISLGSSTSPLTAIELQATAINNESDTDSVELHAASISLNGVTDASSVPTATAGSQGSFTLAAKNITIAESAVAVNGFAQTNFNASQQVSVSDSGTLSVGGDLNIAAARITAAASSNGVVAATGDVQLSQVSNTSSLPTLELGGALTISGDNVTDDAQIIAPSGIVSLNADNQLTLGSTATINVAGAPVYAAGVRADSSGGTIKLSAGQDLSAAIGSTLSVAGSGDTDAGGIGVNAGGTVDIKSTLNAASTATGGSFVLQAGRLTDFASLNAALQTSGFSAKQSINVAHGDLIVANDAAQNITAHDVQLVTDDGVITIAGTISAPSTDDRGSIRIYGADGVTLTSTGELHADGDTTSGRGGTIEIGISTDTTNHANARIDLQSDLQSHSVITADGAEQGSLLLRAPVVADSTESNADSTFGNDIAITALNADLSKVGKTTLEAVLPTYTQATFDTALSDATTYVEAANTNVQTRLNQSGSHAVVLSPGIELTSDADMDITDALDLIKWRFNGTIDGDATAVSDKTPVALTIRATGSINIDSSISDGFTSAGTGTRKYLKADPNNASSATLRLVAGSNIDSADPLAVTTNAEADITLGENVLVRTGTGDLSLVAARDVVFNSGSGVYTGGTNAITQSVTTTTGASSSFLTKGGQLLISAGHDVLGYALTDSVTAWQPRTGCVSECGTLTADQKLTSWGVDIRQFLWNVGTLGGGDLTITAGNDITNLSAAVADSAKETADKTAMTYYGGGSLDMKAGNNINSGMVYVGHSTGTIEAGGAVTTSSAWQDNNGNNLGLLIAMGDSQVSVEARTGIAVADVVNPTELAQATKSKQASFVTYDEDSSLYLQTSSGDATLGSDTYNSFFGAETTASGVTDQGSQAPPSVTVKALSGDISDTSIALYPSDRGQLELFAARDIENASIKMSDYSLTELYTPLNPNFSTGTYWTKNSGVQYFNTDRHDGDTIAVSITAGRDILHSGFIVPKSIQVNAGRDIVNSGVTAQNVNADDVSEIVAGRDLIPDLISIGGPGRLDVLAGRNIDLGVQQGIETTGNLNNANLPTSDGADITVMAGIAAGWNVNSFIDEIVAKSITGSQDLIDFVEASTGEKDLTLAQAVTEFKALSSDTQRPFVLKQFFAELVASGREANADATKGYSRGYAAIDALLPDSRSDNNPYSGNINMLYSRIYTLSGGNIDLFVPGGSLNVGLAAAPVNANTKEAGQLGIVAEKAGSVDIFTNNDVSVNSSRIFTLLGGDIAIWSTVGNIDAGKGAKTSLSIPAPSISYDDAGNAIINLSGAVAGSGIRTIQTDNSIEPGNVDLIAPAGYVNAGDAGIGSAGNINIAAKQVIGAENINFGGNATGVPAETSGLAASLSGAAAVGGSSDSNSAKSVSESTREDTEQKTPITQAALSWLEVFVVGLGEENCKQDDMECLKRQK